ncbi:MAG: exo-alpha-sialidase [Thermoplasmata archaeon]|nr:MAG: exo-alpha-sialidase [Thermoplasmata archaeon]
MEQDSMTWMSHKKKAMVLAVTCSLMISCSFIPFDVLNIARGDPPFSDSEKVNSDSGSASQSNPSVAVDASGNVYVAWEDYRNGNWDVFFASSSDGGDTWLHPNIQINDEADFTHQSKPALAVDDSGTIYAVWQDHRRGDWDIFFAKSLDGGATWTTPNVRISTGTNNKTQSSPDIALDSAGNIYVVWHDNRNSDYDIYFASSMNGGVSWTDPNERVNTDSFPSPNQENPSIAVNSTGVIYVAWQDMINENWDIYLGKSEDGGDTWSDPSIKVNSDTTTTQQRLPSLAVGPKDNLYLTWQDYRNTINNDIYFAMSADSGVSWTHPNVRVNDDIGLEQYEPCIAVGSLGTLYVTWYDDRNGDYDIYYADSIDGGKTWTWPNYRVDDDPDDYIQWQPSVAVGATGYVHVVWEDYRSEHYDIYSARIKQNHPLPTADSLSVEGFYESTPEIMHLISHEPSFGFTYKDPNSDDMAGYNASVWDADGANLLWECNISHTASSGSEVTLKYNTLPYPTNGPSLLDGTTYKLVVSVENVSGVWGKVAEVEFHLNEVLPPQAPVTPSDDALIAPWASQTVTWTSPGADSEGDHPTSYTWEVAEDAAFTTVIESGSGLVTESGAFDTTSEGDFFWRVHLTDGWETSSFGNQPDGYWNFTAVTGAAPNNPPQITNKDAAPSTGFVGVQVAFTFEAADPDSDPLTWSKSSGAAWLSMGANNGTIYGTPSTSDLGSNQFTIKVSDGKGGNDTHTFTIAVNLPSASNNPPSITNKNEAPSQAVADEFLTFTFNATDPDSDPLTWSRLSGPTWLKIGQVNGTLYGTPSSDNVGTNTFNFQVADGRGGADNHSFTITVTSPSDGQDDDDDGDDGTPFPYLCILLIIIMALILVVLLVLLLRRKKPKEAQTPPGMPPYPSDHMAERPEPQRYEEEPPPPQDEIPPPDDFPPEDDIPPPDDFPPEDDVPPPDDLPPEDDIPPPDDISPEEEIPPPPDDE